MNPPESLLQAAHRDADPTAALACADWYDEHDQPEQARLMRLSVKLEQLGPGHPDSLANLDQARRALVAWRLSETRLAMVPGNGSILVDSLRHRPRGLPDILEITDPKMFANMIHRWFADWPARSLRSVLLRPSQLRAILSAADAELMTGLQFTAYETGQGRCTEVLARAGRRMRFTRLGVHLRDWTDPHVDEFRQATASEPPRAVRFGASGFLPSVPRLTANGWGRSIESLDLISNQGSYLGMTPWTAETLAPWGDSTAFPRLRSLMLSDLPLTGNALQAFARPESFAHLERLRIRHRATEPIDWAYLGILLRRGTLHELDLSETTALTAFQIDAMLIEAGNLEGLRVLNLAGCRLPTGSLAQLAEWPGLRSLTCLDLSNTTGPVVEDWLALMRSPHLTALQSLRVQGCYLPPEVFRAINDQFADGRMRELRISLNLREAEPEWAALFDSPTVRNLRRVLLNSPSSTADTSVRWIGNHALLPALEDLRLEVGALEPASLTPMLEGDSFPHLWRIHAEGMQALWPPPRRLLGTRWTIGRPGELIRTELLR